VGPKEVWKQPFQMKVHLNCEDDEVKVNHLESIHHLPKFRSHLRVAINITPSSNVCQVLVTFPKQPSIIANNQTQVPHVNDIDGVLPTPINKELDVVKETHEISKGPTTKDSIG
jgi:hypothetical protein